MKSLKKSSVITFILGIALLLSLTGCKGLWMDRPSSNNSGSSGLPENKQFARTHSGGEYDGFIEIYFDNYEDKILQSSGFYINRKSGNDDFNTIGEIYTEWSNSAPAFSSLPSSFIDYYTDDGIEYTYQLCFYDHDHRNIVYSDSQNITAVSGLGEITITQGNASFNETTGILTFSTLPTFHYNANNGYFNYIFEKIEYAYPEGTSNYVFFLNINDISDNKLNVYNTIINTSNGDSVLGKILTPADYIINLYKYYNDYSIRYFKYTDIKNLPSLNIPNPLPDVPLPENERFVRTHSGGEYDGYTEIYFDNYDDKILQSSRVDVQRTNANGGWNIVYNIYTPWNGNENPLFTDSLPPVIDYYADQDTEYTYRLRFYNYNNSTGDRYEEYTSSQKKTAEEGLGEITGTQVTASFDDATGILTFSTLPSINYTPVNGYFDETYEQFYYKYPYGNGNSSISFDISDISDSKLNIYNAINDYWDSERLLGKTWTPGNYYLELRKNTGNYTINYEANLEITGLPSLEIPNPLPDVLLPENERFVRTHSGGEYDGYTEIYFDNYEEEIRKSNRIMIHRKKADGNWDYVFNIYTNWNGNTNPLFTDIPTSVIDFYTEEDTEYTYRLNFYYHNNSTGDHYDEYSPSQKIPVEKGLGEITVTQGIESSFDRDTGILTFSTVPDFHYTSVSGYFDRNYEYIEYSYPYETWTSQVGFSMENISENKLNIYNEIANGNSGDYARTIGKTITPRNYYLELTKDMENYSSSYQIDIPVTTGYLKSINIPDPLPTASFIKLRTANDYHNYIEFYFDNYIADFRRSSLAYIERKSGNGDWQMLYRLDTCDFNVHFSVAPSSLIDYYTNPATTYSYHIHFSDRNGFNWQSEDISITSQAGLGEITFQSIGSTTYADGILEFTTLPTISCPSGCDFFNQDYDTLFYSFLGRYVNDGYGGGYYKEFSVNIEDLTNNHINIYQKLRNQYSYSLEDYLNHPLTPYLLIYILYKDMGNYTLEYWTEKDISNCPEISGMDIPETLP